MALEAKMIDISEKIETKRMAVAKSSVRAREETIQRIAKGDTPKGDVLNVAKTAAILAAKRTPDLIPYCHPLPIDTIKISYEIDETEIHIRAKISTIGRTGVEMEALTAVSVAALNIYDMAKGIDKEIVIGETKLIEKRGGKTDFENIVPAPIRTAILVSSDSVSSGKKDDTSGKIIEEAMKRFPVNVEGYEIVPDDQEIIQNQIREWTEIGVQMILSTGGTGLGPRDVTVEAVRELIDKEVPGIAEAMRQYGQRRTPYAMLSRSLVGTIGNTLVICLPGSSKGVTESLSAIFPAVLHSFNMMKGCGH
jgi:cyclic pyranopterin monophosphate synthase